MKQRFPSEFSLPQQNLTNQDKALYLQLKAVTDDLRAALAGGLTYGDNLNSSIKQFKINSGVEISLGTLNGAKPAGAQIINTDSTTVTSYKLRTGKDGTLYATVTTDITPATITFLIIGG